MLWLSLCYTATVFTEVETRAAVVISHLRLFLARKHTQTCRSLTAYKKPVRPLSSESSSPRRPEEITRRSGEKVTCKLSRKMLVDSDRERNSSL